MSLVLRDLERKILGEKPTWPYDLVTMGRRLGLDMSMCISIPCGTYNIR